MQPSINIPELMAKVFAELQDLPHESGGVIETVERLACSRKLLSEVFGLEVLSDSNFVHFVNNFGLLYQQLKQNFSLRPNKNDDEDEEIKAIVAGATGPKYVRVYFDLSTSPGLTSDTPSVRVFSATPLSKPSIY